MFRLSKWLPTRTARTHAACVSLSFFNDVKQRGKDYSPFHRYSGHRELPDPFWVVPAITGQCILNSHRDLCAASAARPSVVALI